MKGKKNSLWGQTNKLEFGLLEKCAWVKFKPMSVRMHVPPGTYLLDEIEENDCLLKHMSQPIYSNTDKK